LQQLKPFTTTDYFSVSFWKVEKDMAQDIENILNSNMDWYHAKFDKTIEEVLKQFKTSFEPVNPSKHLSSASLHSQSQKSDSSNNEESPDYFTSQKDHQIFRNLNLNAFKCKYQEDADKTEWTQVNLKKIYKSLQ
jgi:hypothetical protein